MTDALTSASLPRKPRHRAPNRLGVERRGTLAGQEERIRFRPHLSGGPSVRSAPASGTLIQMAGTPIVYNTPYTVFDPYGSFTEIIAPGALTAILPKSDCRLLFNHTGLCLARTTSGTLTLTDSRKALQFAAGLDPRQSLANDLIIAIQRGDISQMSCCFVVDPAGDSWNSDFSKRVISKFSELVDVSAVTYPASPTTEIMLDQPDPDGTLVSGPGNAPGIGNDDGTGSRAARARLLLQIDEDSLRLSRPPAR